MFNKRDKKEGVVDREPKKIQLTSDMAGKSYMLALTANEVAVLQNIIATLHQDRKALAQVQKASGALNMANFFNAFHKVQTEMMVDAGIDLTTLNTAKINAQNLKEEEK